MTPTTARRLATALTAGCVWLAWLLAGLAYLVANHASTWMVGVQLVCVVVTVSCVGVLVLLRWKF